MLAVGTGGAKPLAAFHLALDQQIAGLQRQLRADGKPVALHTCEVNFEPVVLAGFQVAIEGIKCGVSWIVAAQLRENIERAVLILAIHPPESLRTT